MLVLLTTARYSRGCGGATASGGSAEEKDHSSSSFLATTGGGAAGKGFGNDCVPSAAKGSVEVGCEGGEKADLIGCGVVD